VKNNPKGEDKRKNKMERVYSVKCRCFNRKPSPESSEHQVSYIWDSPHKVSDYSSAPVRYLPSGQHIAYKSSYNS